MTVTRFSYLSLLLALSFVTCAAFGANAKRKPSGDELYRSNCTRCHSEWPKLSDRHIEVSLRHMRVRANLPTKDAVAIARYLQGREETDAANK